MATSRCFSPWAMCMRRSTGHPGSTRLVCLPRSGVWPVGKGRTIDNCPGPTKLATVGCGWEDEALVDNSAPGNAVRARLATRADETEQIPEKTKHEARIYPRRFCATADCSRAPDALRAVLPVEFALRAAVRAAMPEAAAACIATCAGSCLSSSPNDALRMAESRALPHGRPKHDA
jgi:hypothetical protein